MFEEQLSFTLRPVETHAELRLACGVRAEAYGRKHFAYRESMAEPDDIDASPWTTVFLCEDKFTGQPVGTMRVQSTTRGEQRLEIEKYVEPPVHMVRHGRAEISRLAAVVGADAFVRVALWKAAYLYSVAIQVRWLIMGVRKPSLMRAYERMGAVDVFDDKHLVPLGHAGFMPHRILALEITSLEQRFLRINPPLFSFIFDTVHRDISVLPSMQRHVTEKIGLHVVEGSREVVQRM